MNNLAIRGKPRNSATKGQFPHHLDSVDLLLVLAVVLLAVMLVMGLAWPALASWLNRPRPGAQVPVRFDASSKDDGTMPVIDHLLYLPEEYGRRNHDWPLVLFLHGSGKRGIDLGKVGRSGPPGMITEGQAFPFVLVSPQCPPGRRWEPEVLLRLIDHVTATYRIDTDRVYVTGFSMGGFGTWSLAAEAPERFAAIALLAGGGDVLQADRFAGLPIWALHGAVDQVVPLEASQSMIDTVRAAGGNAKLTVYENEGHAIDGLTYSNGKFWDWILTQRRGSNPAMTE